MDRLTLALDVMGGDIGPRITIPASIKALESDPMLSLLLFGDNRQISPLLAECLKNQSDSLKNRLTLCHTDHSIANDQPLTDALRRSHGSSMRLAVEAVKNGSAQGCVSAGNTAALMGLAKILLQPLENIDRPALVSVIPTLTGEHSVMLDLGANIECSSDNLYQFAAMGAAFAESRLGLVYPRIALLNIGTEAVKGHRSVREAANLLQKSTALHYIGFIEGDKLLNGCADVIVSDGFSGNIALKTLEGAAKSVVTLLKNNTALAKNRRFCKPLLSWLMRKLFLKGSFQHLQRINPEQYNGASLIGLRAVVVKSHGSAGVNAFAYAIADAALQVRRKMPANIAAGLKKVSVN